MPTSSIARPSEIYPKSGFFWIANTPSGNPYIQWDESYITHPTLGQTALELRATPQLNSFKNRPLESVRRLAELCPFYISTRVARFFLLHDTKTGEKCTKLTQNVPNGHKVSHRKTFQMAIKYVNIFQSTALQILP
jgi:hypothetical protein